MQKHNQCLDYLIDSIFPGVNRLFILSFEDNAHETISNLWLMNMNFLTSH